jgi:hypothetical protein
MKTIIAVWGPKNAGKSSSIHRAYEELIQRPGSKRIAHERVGEVKRQPKGNWEVELMIWEIDGVKVGFSSPGDTEGRIRENLEYLIGEKCTIIICATHTPQSDGYPLVDWFAAKEKPPYKVVRLRKTQQAYADKETGWQAMADEIIKAFDNAVASQPVEA